MGKEFEYTGPDTPQQNGHVEQKFINLLKSVHIMLNDGKFSAFLRNGLSTEVDNMTALLEVNPVTLNWNI